MPSDSVLHKWSGKNMKRIEVPTANFVRTWANKINTDREKRQKEPCGFLVFCCGTLRRWKLDAQQKNSKQCEHHVAQIGSYNMLYICLFPAGSRMAWEAAGWEAKEGRADFCPNNRVVQTWSPLLSWPVATTLAKRFKQRMTSQCPFVLPVTTRAGAQPVRYEAKSLCARTAKEWCRVHHWTTRRSAWMCSSRLFLMSFFAEKTSDT